jgi:hypothetical protein
VAVKIPHSLAAPEIEKRLSLLLIVDASGDWREAQGSRDGHSGPTHLQGYRIVAKTHGP